MNDLIEHHVGTWHSRGGQAGASASASASLMQVHAGLLNDAVSALLLEWRMVAGESAFG